MLLGIQYHYEQYSLIDNTLMWHFQYKSGNVCSQKDDFFIALLFEAKPNIKTKRFI